MLQPTKPRLKLPKFSSEKTKIWHVSVPGAAKYDLTFKTRRQARDYRKLLASSLSKLDSELVAHEFFDGYIETNKES